MHSTFARTRIVFVSILVGAAGLIALAGWGVARNSSPDQELQDVARQVKRVVNVGNLHEWFRRQYMGILAIDIRLRAAEGAMATFEATIGPPHKRGAAERQRWREHHDLVSSLRRERASMVALYNSRAQIVNQDIFKDGDIPIELN